MTVTRSWRFHPGALTPEWIDNEVPWGVAQFKHRPCMVLYFDDQPCVLPLGHWIVRVDYENAIHYHVETDEDHNRPDVETFRRAAEAGESPSTKAVN